MFSTATAFPPIDPTRLCEHVRQCACARGPMHRLQCAAEAADAFFAPRFVTTLALLTVIVVLGLAWPV